MYGESEESYCPLETPVSKSVIGVHVVGGKFEAQKEQHLHVFLNV